MNKSYNVSDKLLKHYHNEGDFTMLLSWLCLFVTCILVNPAYQKRGNFQSFTSRVNLAYQDFWIYKHEDLFTANVILSPYFCSCCFRFIQFFSSKVILIRVIVSEGMLRNYLSTNNCAEMSLYFVTSNRTINGIAI